MKQTLIILTLLLMLTVMSSSVQSANRQHKRERNVHFFGLDLGVGPFDLGLHSISLLGLNVVEGRNELELNVPEFVFNHYNTNTYIVVTPFHYRRHAGKNYYSVINIKPYLNIIKDREPLNVSMGPFVSLNYTPYYDTNKYIASVGILNRLLVFFHAEAGYRVVDGRGGGYYFKAMFDGGMVVALPIIISKANTRRHNRMLQSLNEPYHSIQSSFGFGYPRYGPDEIISLGNKIVSKNIDEKDEIINNIDDPDGKCDEELEQIGNDFFDVEKELETDPVNYIIEDK